MNIRRLLLALFLVLVGLTLQAQGEYPEQQSTKGSKESIHNIHSDSTHERGEHNVGWLRSHIMDNWIIGLQGGGQLYYGFEDTKGSFIHHITGNVEGYFGRWIFPMVGLRAVAGFGTSHGFISIESYKANRDEIIQNGGYGSCGGNHDNSPITVGSETFNGDLSGYYWPLNGSDDVLLQKWDHVYAGADFLVNLSYLKRYNRVKMNRVWENIMYVGFQVHAGISEAHPQRFSDRFGRSTIDGRLVNTNFAAEGHIGYILKCNLSRHWAFNFDTRLSLIEGLFDRERIPGVEKMTPDLNYNLMAGLSYDFNFRNKTKRLKYYVENNVLPYNMDPNSLPKFIDYIQVEDVDIINIVDSLLVIVTDTVNDQAIIDKKKALEEQRQRLIDQFKDIPPDATLSSILNKRMLPYEMVFFERDKWDIRPQEELKIARMARIMKAFPEFTFRLYGSADSRMGTVKRNWFLSENRADVVYNKLVYEYDIPKEQLKREWLGGILDYDPYVLNRTTVIIMDHPAVRQAFEEMKSQRKAGGGVATY